MSRQIPTYLSMTVSLLSSMTVVTALQKTTNNQHGVKTEDGQNLAQIQNAGAKRHDRPSYERQAMPAFGITKGKQQIERPLEVAFGITKGKQQMKHEYLEKSDFQGHVSFKKSKPNSDSRGSTSDHPNLNHQTSCSAQSASLESNDNTHDDDNNAKTVSDSRNDNRQCDTNRRSTLPSSCFTVIADTHYQCAELYSLLLPLMYSSRTRRQSSSPRQTHDQSKSSSAANPFSNPSPAMSNSSDSSPSSSSSSEFPSQWSWTNRPYTDLLLLQAEKNIATESASESFDAQFFSKIQAVTDILNQSPIEKMLKEYDDGRKRYFLSENLVIPPADYIVQSAMERIWWKVERQIMTLKPESILKEKYEVCVYKSMSSNPFRNENRDENNGINRDDKTNTTYGGEKLTEAIETGTTKTGAKREKKTLNVEDFVDEIGRQLSDLNVKLLSGHNKQQDRLSEANSSSPATQRRRAGFLTFLTDGLFGGGSLSPRSNKTVTANSTASPDGFQLLGGSQVSESPLIQFLCSGSLVCDDWHVELREIKKALEKFYELRKVVNRVRWIRKIVGSFRPCRG